MSTDERVLTAHVVSFVNFIANASTPRECLRREAYRLRHLHPGEPDDVIVAGLGAYIHRRQISEQEEARVFERRRCVSDAVATLHVRVLTPGGRLGPPAPLAVQNSERLTLYDNQERGVLRRAMLQAGDDWERLLDIAAAADRRYRKRLLKLDPGLLPIEVQASPLSAHGESDEHEDPVGVSEEDYFLELAGLGAVPDEGDETAARACAVAPLFLTTTRAADGGRRLIRDVSLEPRRLAFNVTPALPPPDGEAMGAREEPQETRERCRPCSARQPRRHQPRRRQPRRHRQRRRRRRRSARPRSASRCTSRPRSTRASGRWSVGRTDAAARTAAAAAFIGARHVGKGRDRPRVDAVERWCERTKRDRTMVRFQGAYGDVPLEDYEYKTYR